MQHVNNEASTSSGIQRKQPQERPAPIHRHLASERAHAAVDYRENSPDHDDVSD